MIIKILTSLFLTAFLIMNLGCERDIAGLEPATYPTNGDVFLDGFSGGLDYQAFSNSKVDAFDVDMNETYKGTSAMKITVPSEGDPSGWYAGGAFISGPRDLSGYNALTFWGKASMVVTAGLIGFGNDNTGNSLYQASQADLAFTTTWKKYIIPIPAPEKLVAEQGMFQFAAGADANGNGYYLWFDEVQFEKLGTIAHPIAEIPTQDISAMIGDTIAIGDIKVTFNISGVEQVVNAMPGYLNYFTDNDTVVSIDNGVIKVIGSGTAVITAKLGTADALGAVTVNVGTSTGPSGPAPTPTAPADSVISLFSNAYTDVSIDTWNTGWEYSTAVLKETKIAGDDVKLYTNLNFVGIEFSSQTIDATSMTHFHMDFWTPDPTTEPAAFIVKLIDFGADGAYDGGDDSSHELSFTAANTSGMASETWVSLDIPLSDFAGMTGKGHIAQMVLSSAEGEFPNTVYVDNVYFYDGGDDPLPANGPISPAPTPTADAASVLSMFSNAYTNATIDTWNTGWQYSTAVVTDVQVAGDDVKLYTNLNFVGIEFAAQPLDASAMNRFHMDIWTPDPSVAPAEFKIKLIDFGADGAYNGGDDSEHELSFSASSNPALATESWVSIDVPMSAFSGLSSQAHLAQMVLSSAEAGFPNTVYIDNVYFYDGDDGTATEPSEAAPTPTFSAGDVISLFSDAYTDVAIDTWSADWDSADLTDEQVSGNNVKLYSNLVFAGIEFTSQTINATDMTHFHIDLWTADPTEAPAEFKIKLVDFGDNGVWDGGDDVEHELIFNDTTNPAMATGGWVNLDIPLSDFTNLTTKGHLAQLIISGDPNTVYIDNILLHK